MIDRPTENDIETDVTLHNDSGIRITTEERATQVKLIVT